jgi:hypothetical protein
MRAKKIDKIQYGRNQSHSAESSGRHEARREKEKINVHRMHTQRLAGTQRQGSPT